MTENLKALRQKQAALAVARENRQKIESDWPGLNAALEQARKKLDETQIGVLVARGTPGLEDDAAAARTVAEAQTRYDQAVQARDAAEERLGFLQRAVTQLDQEIGALQGKALMEHWEISKQALRDRIGKAKPLYTDLIGDVITLDALMNRAPAFVADVGQVVQDHTGLDLQRIIMAAKDRAAAIRAGGEV